MSNNPYQAPSADLTTVFDEGYDDSPRLSARGRTGRANYITFSTLYVLAIAFVMGIVSVLALRLFGDVGSIVSALVMIVGVVYIVSVVLRLQIRRLHDLNMTGWLVLLPFVLSCVNLAITYGSISINSGSSSMVMVLSIIVMLLQTAYSCYLAFFPGNSDANQYAAPPEPPATWSVVIAIIMVLIGIAFVLYYLYMLSQFGFDFVALNAYLQTM